MVVMARKSKFKTAPKVNEAVKVLTQAFTLTFLAEWGDRSQIATIALAASKNPYGVVIGGLIGHCFLYWARRDRRKNFGC